MEQTKFKRFKKIIFTITAFLFITIGSSQLSWCCNNNSYNHINSDKIYDVNDINIETPVNKEYDSINKEYDSINKEYDSTYAAVLKVTANYINKQAPKAHNDLPKYLLDAALEYDIDLCFMMAQTQLETNFGTLGAGREKSRRSLFGVYTKKYTSYEYARDDWCNLLNKSYLGKGRTEEHLMNSYTSHSGKRYAENPSYEISLKSTYKSIVKSTGLKQMQTELKNMA